MLRPKRFAKVAAVLLAAALLLCACNTGQGMDLRLFCQRYSAAAKNQARLTVQQFLARQQEDGCKYETYLGENLMLTLDAQPSGRVHTITLTALPETPQSEFRSAAVNVIQVYCGAADGLAERWLNAVHAGEAETLGFQEYEENGFRLSFYASAAGRWLRVAQVRYLPPREEPLTLRDTIPMDN